MFKSILNSVLCALLILLVVTGCSKQNINDIGNSSLANKGDASRRICSADELINDYEIVHCKIIKVSEKKISNWNPNDLSEKANFQISKAEVIEVYKGNMNIGDKIDLGLLKDSDYNAGFYLELLNAAGGYFEKGDDVIVFLRKKDGLDFYYEQPDGRIYVNSDEIISKGTQKFKDIKNIDEFKTKVKKTMESKNQSSSVLSESK